MTRAQYEDHVKWDHLPIYVKCREFNWVIKPFKDPNNGNSSRITNYAEVYRNQDHFGVSAD